MSIPSTSARRPALATAILTAFIVAVGTLAGVTSAVAADPGTSQSTSSPASALRGGDRDCGDFANQAAAQHFFLDHGGPRSDPHRLDSDGDGIACESNPCPCYTGTGGGGGGPAPAPDPTIKQRAVIVKVVDGDTYDVRLLPRGPKKRVRAIGIDTPEVYGGLECWGRKASTAAKHLLPRGTRVLLVSDNTQDVKDRYGRLLRYVMKSGKDVNRMMVARGHARMYVYDHKPFKRTRTYKTAQAAAQRNDRGLWRVCGR